MAFYKVGGSFLTVGGAFAISSNCCCGNEQWRKCSDDTNLAVLSQGHTAVDYAWLCVGSVWVKGYNYTTTATASTNPSVLEQCDNPAPTVCADLVGLPASDTFNGTGCNSGTKGDTNDGIRWTHAENSNGTISIAAGILTHIVNTTGIRSMESLNNLPSRAGNFECSSDVVFNSGQPDGINSHNIRFYIKTSSNYSIWLERRGPSRSIQWAYRVFVNGTEVVTEVDNGGAFSSVKWTKSSGTLTAYVDGVSVWSGSDSTTMDGFQIQTVLANSSVQMDVDFDNYILDDGGVSELYIDPSGVACT